MGCTSSRPSPPDPGTAGAQQPRTTSSTTAAAAPPPATRRTSSRPSLPRSPISTHTRPNKLLRSPSPVPKCPPERALQPWTAAQLGREREAFFETRVTGDAAAWGAIRAVCELLREGDLQGAQGVLDAAGLTCPTGRIKSDRVRGERRRGGGVFDVTGRGYDIPGWVVRDPEDLVEEVTEKKTEEEDKEDEKGKGRAEELGELVKVRARLSDRGSDVVAEVGERQKVRTLVKQIAELAGEGKRVKLVYLGKVLVEDKTLEDQGWQQGHVLNALVFD